MSGSMDILIVEPRKAPRPAVIQNTLEAAEKILCEPAQIGCFLSQKGLQKDDLLFVLSIDRLRCNYD